MSACKQRDLGSIPGSGRSSGEGNGNPLQYSCLENPMDGGSWWATVHGAAKSRTQLSDFTFTFTLKLKVGFGCLPLKSQQRDKVDGKESLLYSGCSQLEWGKANLCPRPDHPPQPNNMWKRGFTGWGRGLHAETSESAQTVILKLVICGLTSIILIILSTANLHFQVQFLFISLRPVIQIVVVKVMATAWSACS